MGDSCLRDGPLQMVRLRGLNRGVNSRKVLVQEVDERIGGKEMI